MKAMFDATGAERKALVTAIAEAVGERARYLGMPSCAYAVGSYEVDKAGTMTAGPDVSTDAFERLLMQLDMKGFRHLTCEDAPAGEADSPNDDDQAPTRFEISVPLTGFTDTQLEMLRQLIASKDSLIRKALNVKALPIVIDENEITFPWFDRALNSFEIKTYAHFIAALCETAKTQKRVVAKDKEVTSERFAFRIFLNRLGFSGREYAEERKLLYTHLSGDCAFPNTQKRDEHAARWKGRRKQAHDDALESTPDEHIGD